jgi:hypothetical protein
MTALGVLSGKDGMLDYCIVPGGMGTEDLKMAIARTVVRHLNAYPAPTASSSRTTTSPTTAPTSRTRSSPSARASSTSPPTRRT